MPHGVGRKRSRSVNCFVHMVRAPDRLPQIAELEAFAQESVESALRAVTQER